MIAVVSPAADENAFTGIVPQEGILQCLISQNSRCENRGQKCNGSHNGDNEKMMSLYCRCR